MVEDFADLASIKLEVRVNEVTETNQSHENDQVGVVSLTLGLERIVTNLVAVRQVVNVVLFVPLVTV
jgi:hypothetical protein